MLFLLKNHSVLSWNTLLLLAAFLLAAGCGPASPGSGQSQPPAAAATQPAAETVTQATGPVPETLWDKRADYEKEGQVVLFTDCGLYKGDTDELTGAKCEFKDGRWVLLEPKLEPKDNLLFDLEKNIAKSGHIKIINLEGSFLPNCFVKRYNSSPANIVGEIVSGGYSPYAIRGDFSGGNARITIDVPNSNLPVFQKGGFYTIIYTLNLTTSDDLTIEPIVSIYSNNDNQTKHRYLKPKMISLTKSRYKYEFNLNDYRNLNNLMFLLSIKGIGNFVINDLCLIRGYLPFEI
ncbi:MAG: hypothetical protein HPY51_00700 [Candidatus Omnitrophica bacterium]|nr:hypothetical protein [Candidatus Omnitrophota bacterium]